MDKVAEFQLSTGLSENPEIASKLVKVDREIMKIICRSRNYEDLNFSRDEPCALEYFLKSEAFKNMTLADLHWLKNEVESMMWQRPNEKHWSRVETVIGQHIAKLSPKPIESSHVLLDRLQTLGYITQEKGQKV